MSQKSIDIPGVIAFPPLIYAAPLMVGILIQRILPLHFLSQPVALWLGILFLGLGLLILLSAVLTMQQAGTNIDPGQPATQLVTRGPFRFSRNPIYLGFTIGYLGTGIWANTLWPILILPIILLVIQYGVIKREERYLENKFGAAYYEYKAHVRRWI